MTGNKKNILRMFLAALILLPVLSGMVFAANPSKGTFHIDVNMKDPNSDNIYHTQVYLYQVASAVVDETNNLHMEPAELCKDLDFDGLTDEKVSGLLDELCKRIKYPGSVPETEPNLVPQAIQKPDKDGMIHFDNLDAGVYLLIKWAQEEPSELEMLPALVSLPTFDQESGTWESTIEVSPKFDWKTEPTPTPDPTPDPTTPPTEPDAKLPQTGMLQWPVPVLVVAGLFLVVIGYAVIRRNRQD